MLDHLNGLAKTRMMMCWLTEDCRGLQELICASDELLTWQIAQAQDPLFGASLSPNPLTVASLEFWTVVVSGLGFKASATLAFSKASLNLVDISWVLNLAANFSFQFCFLVYKIHCGPDPRIAWSIHFGYFYISRYIVIRANLEDLNSQKEQNN